MNVFEADWICPISSPPIRNGFLAVDENLISSVGAVNSEGFALSRSRSADRPGGHRPPLQEGTNRVAFPGCAIIPGFVNAHTHIELTILRGFLEDLPFVDWIRRLTDTKYNHLSRDEVFLSARLGAAEMLAAGVTCVGEVMDLGVAWDALRESGLQGIAFQEVFGPDETLADQQLSDLKEKVNRLRLDQTDTLRAGVSPHAPYTVSAKLYRSVQEYAERERLPLTTHIAESNDEGLFVRFGGGVFADRFAERGIELPPPANSPIAYLDSLNLVGGESLLVHAIDIEDTDLAILKEKKPRIVHCPKSNAKLGHGIARISDFRDVGLTVGLGTDSVASNNVVDMFEEMRAAIFQQRARTGRLDALDAKAAFQMATIDGAACLGLSHLFGSLEQGKRADFVVVDLNDVALQPVYDPIETMVYSACRANVCATYIAGKQVKIETQGMIDEAKRIAERIPLLR